MQDMAGTILFLASRAGSYVNGAVWLVDGGRIGTVASTYWFYFASQGSAKSGNTYMLYIFVEYGSITYTYPSRLSWKNDNPLQTSQYALWLGESGPAGELPSFQPQNFRRSYMEG